MADRIGACAIGQNACSRRSAGFRPRATAPRQKLRSRKPRIAIAILMSAFYASIASIARRGEIIDGTLGASSGAGLAKVRVQSALRERAETVEGRSVGQNGLRPRHAVAMGHDASDGRDRSAEVMRAALRSGRPT